MTVITPNGISGINSITAQSGTLEFYNASGSIMSVTGNVTGNVNSTGVSTFTTLRATSVVGVVTAGITTAYVTSINDGPLSGSRNRIINGDCRIDQRNNGASVNTSDAYPVDRFQFSFSGGGVITGQRSGTTPVGFTSSLSLTVSTADSSIAAGDFYNFQHKIEGFNVSDFGFGTANASSITLSFWVRSSVTGTYAGGLNNSNATRSYVFTYTINASNTWEYKSVTIPGDTTGTWLSDSSIGFRIIWDLGSGSNFNGTANAWTGSNVFRTSGSANWIATNGATFFVTGIQLESGTVASAFERRSYGQEFTLCQRYYQVLNIVGNSYAAQYSNNGNFYGQTLTLPTQLRDTPSSITYENVGGSNYWVEVGSTAFSANSTTGITFTSNTNTIVMVQPRQAGNSVPTRNAYYMWEATCRFRVTAEL